METRRHDQMRALVQRMRTRRAFAMVAVVLVASVTVGPGAGRAFSAGVQTYAVTDLGTLGTTTVSYGINASAEIVGRSYLQQTVPGDHCTLHHPNCRVQVFHAFRYSAGRIIDLGTLGGTFSDARAVNGNGDVAGFSTLSGTSLSPTFAFLYSNGKMKDMGTLGGRSSHAYGINDFGQVVGDSYTASGADDAFLYSAGKMTDLGALGSLGSSANDINNVHQVVGGSEVANGSGMHAFLWSNGTMKDIGTLGGPQSIAYAINDGGQITGYSTPPNRSAHAFLYSGGKMTDLGVFFDSSVGEAINTSGLVVGQADVLNNDGTTQYHAFIYSGGSLRDLNTLIPAGSGFVLTEATGINDAGQIVCNGYNPTNGQIHAFLLNPT
jgi:probable HAF family extracellular repeat protein